MRLLIAGSLKISFMASSCIFVFESVLPVSSYRRCARHSEIAQLPEVALLPADHSEAAEQV